MYCNTFFCNGAFFPLGVLGVHFASRQSTGQQNAQSAHGIKGKTAPVAR
jgi:hypothetical protein